MEIIKSNFIYDNNKLILNLYYDELPRSKKIKEWINRNPTRYLTVYMYANNVGINVYDRSTYNYTFLFNSNKLFFEFNDVLYIPDIVEFTLANEYLKIYLYDNKITKIDFNIRKIL
jgi:hypothetical protein